MALKGRLEREALLDGNSILEEGVPEEDHLWRKFLMEDSVNCEWKQEIQSDVRVPSMD